MMFFSGNGSCTVDIYDPKTKKWEELELAKSMSVYAYTVVRNKVFLGQGHAWTSGGV